MKKTTKKLIGILASTVALGAAGIIGSSSVSAAPKNEKVRTSQRQKTNHQSGSASKRRQEPGTPAKSQSDSGQKTVTPATPPATPAPTAIKTPAATPAETAPPAAPPTPAETTQTVAQPAAQPAIEAPAETAQNDQNDQVTITINVDGQDREFTVGKNQSFAEIAEANGFKIASIQKVIDTIGAANLPSKSYNDINQNYSLKTIGYDQDNPPNLKITTKVVDSNSVTTKITYNFFNPEADEHFQLECDPGQTVLTTKEVIQKKYELPDPQDVTLLFSGKALRDGFVLDRLRIGAQNVVIHIKDRRTLLIYSGRNWDSDSEAKSKTKFLFKVDNSPVMTSIKLLSKKPSFEDIFEALSKNDQFQNTKREDWDIKFENDVYVFTKKVVNDQSPEPEKEFQGQDQDAEGLNTFLQAQMQQQLRQQKLASKSATSEQEETSKTDQAEATQDIEIVVNDEKRTFTVDKNQKVSEIKANLIKEGIKISSITYNDAEVDDDMNIYDLDDDFSLSKLTINGVAIAKINISVAGEKEPITVEVDQNTPFSQIKEDLKRKQHLQISSITFDGADVDPGTTVADLADKLDELVITAQKAEPVVATDQKDEAVATTTIATSTQQPASETPQTESLVATDQKDESVATTTIATPTQQVTSETPQTEKLVSDKEGEVTDAVQVQIMLSLSTSIVPQLTKVYIKRGTKLGQIRDELKKIVYKKWGLGTLETEFGWMDVAEDNYTTITSNNDADITDSKMNDEYTLTVRDATGSTSGGMEEAEATATTNPDEEVLEDEELDPDQPDQIQILFKVDQRNNQQVKLVFNKKSKVEEARVKVATKLGVAEDAVTLLYAGRALKDAFVLDRLRVGEQGISVYVKDTTEVLLLTAKSNKHEIK